MTQQTDEVGDGRQRAQIEQSAERRIISSGGPKLDQEARDIARDAIARIESHERVCMERWGQQHVTMERVEGLQRDIKQSLDKQIARTPAALIAALMGVVGYLADRAFPLH